METVDQKEWVIRELDGDAAVIEEVPGGGTCRLERSLLPDDIAPGDRFRVVAQVERRPARAGVPDAEIGEVAREAGRPAATSGQADAPEEAPAAAGDAAPAAGEAARAGGGGPPSDRDRPPSGRDDGPGALPDAMSEALEELTRE